MTTIIVRTGKGLTVGDEEMLARCWIPVVFKNDQAFGLTERVTMVLERLEVAAPERQT